MVLAPETVDMKKAVTDFHPKKGPGLSRDPNSEKTYSPTGIWGDTTLATREKGEAIVAALTEAMLADVAALRVASRCRSSR